MWSKGRRIRAQGSEGLLADRYAEFVIDYALEWYSQSGRWWLRRFFDWLATGAKF